MGTLDIFPGTTGIGPGKAMYLGPYLTTHRNKTVNVYKIKHIDIVLVFPTKLVFKPEGACAP
jgi:hypothetical protein